MNDLEKLGIKYETDKIGKHHYLPVYYDLFKDRQNEIKKVLEIGIGEGASLRMWNDFFPNAMIYGADIEPERYIKERDYPRIEIIDCDQSSKESLEFLIGETNSDIDLLIDDGSHKPEDQLFTCLIMMEMLEENIVYVIEDVVDENIMSYLTKYDSQLIRVGKRYDDQLIIVRYKK